MPTAVPLDTRHAVDWYRRNRARSGAIFDLIDPAAYYSRPIALRNPIVFYEGHLPAFSVLAFLRRGLGRPAVDARLEKLFERGIDPESEESAVPRSGAGTAWPSRDEVRAFARACDEAVLDAIASMKPEARAIEGLYTALEHEAMHQETLLYMWHRLPYAQKHGPGSGLGTGSWGASPLGSVDPLAQESRGVAPGQRRFTDLTPAKRRSTDLTPKRIPAGVARLGGTRGDLPFGWDNEFDAHDVHVPAFDIDALPVTNTQFLEFMNAGGYANRALWDNEGWEWIQRDGVTHPAFWIPAESSAPRASQLAPGDFNWRAMFNSEPLPADWPVYVSHAEASAYARWRGRRVMTEAEFHRAAEGATPGHVDFAGFDPVPTSADPRTASVWDVHDLIGNGWEWTSTVFAPFEGFTPMPSYPEYSADFFDGRHYVMKGASPATARELIRPSFRNWFRANYPYVYAKFRTAL